MNLENHSSQTRNSKKPPSFPDEDFFENERRIDENTFLEHFRENFLMEVSDKSQSAGNLEQSFMFAKLFVSSKNWGEASMEKNSNSHLENTPVFKKTKVEYRVLGLKKTNFRTKIFHFEKSHNAEN